MQHTPLGRTGRAVSRLCLGTIVGARRPPPLDDVLPASEKSLDAALEARLDEMTTREYRWGDDPR
jgi:aryl-alcohol dehydrogenase-like predicted oxidoreductase